MREKEEHKGERKSRETDVSMLLPLNRKIKDYVCSNWQHIYSFFINSETAALHIKVQIIIWISATDMFSLNAQRSHSWTELFVLDAFQFTSHPASAAACPLWLQQTCKQGIVLEMTA